MGSKAYFDEIAGNWDKMQETFFDNTVRHKAYELAEIEKGKTAADIGAGTGFITEGLLWAGIDVIAVDQSAQMLQVISEKFTGIGKLKCINCDGHAIEMADESVDYVFANMYLHHARDPFKAVREMFRILKKDGKLIITDLDEHDYDFLKTEQQDVWLGFDREQLKAWYLRAGFKKADIHCVGSDCCATSLSSGEKVAKVSIFAALGVK